MKGRMKLSTKGRYGLRAILDLAVYGKEQPVSIRSISERQDISERYLEQLIAKLKKAGLVESIRGAGGGYRIARPADTISVGEVLYVLEGSLNPVDCVSDWSITALFPSRRKRYGERNPHDMLQGHDEG